MVSMTVDQIGIYTVADLERERDRDDLLRWELLDGDLVVTPSPRPVHQRIVGRLHLRLVSAADDSLEVFVSPLDVRLSERTVLQPDLMVLRAADVDDEGITAVPLLAVEILSPSTRRRDPEDASVRIWDLTDGSYVLTTHATGDQEVRVSEPVEVTFRVADLMPPTA